MKKQNNKALHIALWAVQAPLAAMFLMIGFMKSTTPLAELSATIPMAGELPWLVRFIGVSEVLAGLGLILPALLRIKPWLTPLAALGLFIIMVLAFGYHAMQAEYASLPVNLVLGAMAAFVAWGRQNKAPIAAKA